LPSLSTSLICKKKTKRQGELKKRFGDEGKSSVQDKEFKRGE
jgi:hypothetical protein